MTQQDQRQPVQPRRKSPKVYTDRQIKLVSRSIGGIVLVVAVGWLLTQVMSSGAQRVSHGNVTQAGFVPVTSLRNGDCFDSATSGDLSEVTVEPCVQAHIGQVLGFVLMTDATYPTDAALQAEAKTDCAPFWKQVSTTWLPSDASNASLVPDSASGFERGDNKITCVEQSPSGQLTGSVLN